MPANDRRSSQAEKLEREKEHTKQKAILGYDPEKCVHTEAKIRDEEHYEIDYVDLKLISPTKGNHKFAYCQDLYEEVHAFLEKKKMGTNQGGYRSCWDHLDRAVRTVRPRGKQKYNGTASEESGSLEES